MNTPLIQRVYSIRMKNPFASPPHIVKLWLPLAAVTVALGGLIYVEVQQSYRQNANDPQIQMANDGADAIAAGAAPTSTVPPKQIDIARSLAPFVIVFGDKQNIVAASGKLGNNFPVPPAGVFDYTKTHGEDRFTWQPQSGVREAAVMTYRANSGYVLAARSLREVEKREDYLTSTVAVALVAILLALFVVVALVK